MKLIYKAIVGLTTLFFLSSLPFSRNIDAAEDQKNGEAPPPRTYIELTESFYRALQNNQSGGDRIYGSTNRSDDYLRQIAISTKFMVETNIQIIKQQEKMIELLDAMSTKRGR